MNKILKVALLFTLFISAHIVFAQKSDFKYYIAGTDQKLYILNQDGKPISNETYSYIGEFSEGLFLVEKSGKFGYIDKKGAIVLPFIYDQASKVMNGVAAVQIDGKYGLIDRKGKYKIIPQYEELYFENNDSGLLKFKNNGLYGLINKSGKVIIPNKYENLGDIENGFVAAESNGNYGLIDVKDNVIAPFIYTYLGSVKNGYSFSFSEKGNPKMGLMNLSGKVLLNPVYDHIYTSLDEVRLIENRKKGIANKYGTVLLKPEYRSDFEGFNEGLMLLEKDGKFGFTNINGQIVIDLIYDAARPFSEGLAPVLKDGKWGFINKKGETSIDFKFVGVMVSFHDGFAAYGKRKVSSGGHYTTDKWGLIDKKGNIVIQNKYDNVMVAYNNNFIVELDGKKLLINDKEEVIALLKYEESPVTIGN